MRVESSSNMDCSGEDVNKPVGLDVGDQRKIHEEVCDSELQRRAGSKKNTCGKKALLPECTAGGKGEGGGGGERIGQPVSPSSTAPSTVLLNPESQQRLLSVLTSPKALSHLKDVNIYVTVKEGSKMQQVNSCMQETLHGNKKSIQAPNNHRDCPTATNNSGVNNSSAAQVAATNGSQHVSHPLISFTDNIGSQIMALLKVLGNHITPTTTITTTTTSSSDSRQFETRGKHQPTNSDLKMKKFVSSPSVGTVAPSLSSSPPLSEDGPHRIIEIDFSAPQSAITRQAHDGGIAIDSSRVGGVNGGASGGVGRKTSDDSEINDLRESQKSVSNLLLRRPLSPSCVSTGDSFLGGQVSTIPPCSRNLCNDSPLYSNDLRRNTIGDSQNFSCEVPSRFSKRTKTKFREQEVIVVDDDSVAVQVSKPALKVKEIAKHKNTKEDVVILDEERDGQFHGGAFIPNEPVTKKRRISKEREAEKDIIVRNVQTATNEHSATFGEPTSQKRKVDKTGMTEENRTSPDKHVTDSFLGKNSKEGMETDFQMPFVNYDIVKGGRPHRRDADSGCHTVVVDTNGRTQNRDSDHNLHDAGISNGSASFVAKEVLTGSACSSNCSHSPSQSNTGDISTNKETTPTSDNAECLHPQISPTSSGDKLHKEEISWACKDQSHKPLSISSPASPTAMCTLRSPRIVLLSLSAGSFRKYHQSLSPQDSDKDRPLSSSMPTSPSATFTKSAEVPSLNSNDELNVDQGLRPCEREGDLPRSISSLPSPSGALKSPLSHLPLSIFNNANKNQSTTTRKNDDCHSDTTPISLFASSTLTRLPLHFQAMTNFNKDQSLMAHKEEEDGKSITKASQSVASLSPTVGLMSPLHSVNEEIDFVSDEHPEHGHFVPGEHQCLIKKKRKEKKKVKMKKKNKKKEKVEMEVNNRDDQSLVNQSIPTPNNDIEKCRGADEPPLLFNNMEGQHTHLSENDDDFGGSNELTLSQNVECQPTPLSDDDCRESKQLHLSQTMEDRPTSLPNHDIINGRDRSELTLSQNMEGHPTYISDHDINGNELTLSQNVEGQSPVFNHDINDSRGLPLPQNMECQPLPLSNRDINNGRGSNKLPLSQNVEASLSDHDCSDSNELPLQQNMKGQLTPLSNSDINNNCRGISEPLFLHNLEGGCDVINWRRADKLLFSENMEGQPPPLLDDDVNKWQSVSIPTFADNVEVNHREGGICSTELPVADHVVKNQNQNTRHSLLSDGDVDNQSDSNHPVSDNKEDIDKESNLGGNEPPVSDDEGRFCNQEPDNQMLNSDDYMNQEGSTISSPPSTDKDVDNQVGIKWPLLCKHEEDVQSQSNANQRPLSDHEEVTDDPRETNVLSSSFNTQRCRQGSNQTRLSNNSEESVHNWRSDSPLPLSSGDEKSVDDQMYASLKAASEDSGRRTPPSSSRSHNDQDSGDNPPMEVPDTDESQSTRTVACSTSLSLPAQVPNDQMERMNVKVPPLDLTTAEQRDCDDRLSSTSVIVTTLARFGKEYSVANSDSQSNGVPSRSSSCNLGDSFNLSDHFSLSESCRSFSGDTRESGLAGVSDKSVEQPSSRPHSLSSSSSWRQRKNWEPSLYASTKVIMTRSKFANLKKIGDGLTISQALISPVHDIVSSSESSASPTECSSSNTNRHMKERSLSISSLDSAASLSSSYAISLLEDSRDSSETGGNWYGTGGACAATERKGQRGEGRNDGEGGRDGGRGESWYRFFCWFLDSLI